MAEIRPQAGPQLEASRCPADILVVGGAAGVGKSWLQTYLAARFHRTPHWNAILFRREQPMLTGGGSLWDEAEKLYPLLKGQSTSRPLEWKWPEVPSRVEMRHMQHEKSAEAHKSKQYTYIGLDEASDFTGKQFHLLSSRLRTLSGVKTQMVLTTNPDPDCYLRPLLDWYISEDGTPDPTRSGKIRYFVRVNDEIVWADAPETLAKYVNNDVRNVKSLCFFPGLIYDNKILMEADPQYLGKLMALPAVDRARFLGGNWNVRESAGDFFQQGVFKIWGGTDLERALMGQDGHPAKIVQSIRVWDTAATPIKGDLVPGLPANPKAREKGSDDPDWTCSVRLDRTANGRIIVVDATFHRDSPGPIESLMERTAIADGPRTTVGIRTDPGQAGVAQTERMQARISRHAKCEVIEQSKSKLEYAKEPSRAAHRGELYYFEKTWNRQFFNQLETFPAKGCHDDAVDALSGAYLWLIQNPAPFFEYAGANLPLIVRPDTTAAFTTKVATLDHAKVNGVRIISGSRGFGRRDW